MKKIIVSLLFSIISIYAFGAYLKNIPTTLTQPDGTVINCFATGDEFYNWVHDKEGYTIIQAPNGYYYYAEQDGDLIKASPYLVNSVDPSSVGLIKWIKISQKEFSRKLAARSKSESAYTSKPSYAPHSGAMNNLVVYIRFADDDEFTFSRQFYNNALNTSDVSLKSYFSEVSYNKLTINSTQYPACSLNSNLSYQDSHIRGYFQPYNATTNRIGYIDDAARAIREQTLLADAINWINTNSPVPSNLNIDGDGDNEVDNVCFIVKGGSGDWNVLLWAHHWSLYSQNVSINGKRVYGYTFQPEDQVGVTTLCHEMFHTLGSPDLYHYKADMQGLSPVGGWDLMESGSGHMSAYMKWKYTNNTWISSIPEITNTGTYTLNPLTSATNNCYKIASPNSSNEYFVVEYRYKTGTFESNIPGSGLIVYRIDASVSGNSNGPPDEVYIYRPGGSLTVDGDVNTANFSSTVGRTAINDATDPSSFLQNGSAGGLYISNVTAAGTTISFKVTLPCTPPTSQASAFTSSGLANNSMTVGWTRGNGNAVLVVARAESAVNAGPVSELTYTANTVMGNGTQLGTGNYVVYKGTGTSVNLTALSSGTTYYYAIYEYNSASNCYLAPALTGNAKTTGTRSSYCTSSGNMSYNTSITSVSFNTINNVTSKPAAYNDYTGLTTTVSKNSTQNLTVKLNTDGNYEIHAFAWIDWNHNYDFSDAGEIYDLGYATNVTNGNTSLSPLNIIIPTTALTGNTRMRVVAKFSTDPFLCETDFDGEVEDYTINVVAACIPPTTKATAFTSSALANNSMTVGWTRGNGSAVLVVARAGSAVNADPVNGTTYTASAAFGNGTQIGTGNYVVYSGTGTSVNLNSLSTGTTYYFSIYEYTSTSNCYLIPALIGNAKTTGATPYCVAGSLATSYEYISNVAIGSINQASVRGTAGYQDYTSQITTMQIGVNNTATVTVTNPYSTDQVLIWVDWNQDGDFDEVGENVYASTGSFASPLTTSSFAPPVGAKIGTTRMRIRLYDTSNGSNATSCGNSSYGEVEDYSVNVINAIGNKTINITAGGLSAALTKTEKSLITNLTITGSIDARDFKILRDSMTLLSVLDISNVTIVAYTGTAGTYSTSSTVYLANEIPADAFYFTSTNSGKTSLTSVTLPLSATSIGNEAFERCSGLIGVFNIPSNVSNIGSYVFYYCSKLTSVNLPAALTTIGSYAFFGCSAITNVTIPTAVTTIGSSAFRYCNNLTGITVQSGNINYSSVDGVLFNKNKSTLIQCPGAKAGSYIIPGTVTSIGDYAFYYCYGLTSVTIPITVTTIGNYAFLACYVLTSITIPSAVTSIGTSAFSSCSGLTSVIIPSSVTSIGINPFMSCTKLTATVVESGNLNYSSSDGLLFNKNQSMLIQFPNGKVGSSYSIPATVTSIGDYAFYNCSGLTSITLPSSVKTIGTYAFADCNGLTSIYVNSKPITLPSSSIFSGVNTTSCTLYVPYSAKTLYTAASYWNSFTNIVESSQGFLLSSNTARILNVAGSSATVEIKANVSWTTSSDQSWLKVSPGSGSGNGTLTLTSANQSQTLRTATVTVSSPGYASQTITVSETNGITYCTAGSTATSAEYISNITIGSINQASVRGTAGYQDYTSQITTMQKGVNTSATITVTNPYSTDQVLIWIDWNQDGDFDEAGENVYASTGSFITPHTTANFAPPAGAKTGITSMRIRLHDTDAGPNATSCGNSSYGEVEDYSVNVANATAVPNVSDGGSIRIYPNPTTGKLEISEIESLGNECKVEIINNLGSLIYISVYKNFGNKISLDLSPYTEGLYLIRLSNNEVSYQKKVIKKKM
jgi:M6 family metalloprotease-like protein